MENTVSSLTHDDRAGTSKTGRVASWLSTAMETLVLILVCLSPWALGSVDAEFEFYLFAGISILLALWAIRMLVEWRVSWESCPVAICLAGMIALGAVQLAPLSNSTLDQVSPGTERIYSLLLPDQPEVLPLGQRRASMPAPAGSTISLYPDATRKSLIYLLAIFSLYVIVRHNIASMGALRRLCIIAVLNGAALSLFGLIQFFANSEPGAIYWTYESPGKPFGPFVNRNHFAFYINLCIGLSLGLLLARSRVSQTDRFATDLPITTRLSELLHEVLHDPTALWISGSLALMLSSVVFCLSRGGFIALIGATTLCGILIVVRGAGNWKLCAALMSVATAMVLLIWFGLEHVEARLSTLWTGEATGDPRVFLLTHAWPLIREFPLLGTGYGTFQYVEPLHLHTVLDVGSIYEHAHNDYLESLIEGGAVGLMLRLVAIGLLFRFAYRACHVCAGTATAALALGLLFAFTSIVIHSFFEFGLYVPAIVMLAVVTCAHISGFASYAQSNPAAESVRLAVSGVDATTNRTRRRKLGLWIVAPPVGALIAVVLGSYLCSEGSRAWTISVLRSEARQLRRAAFDGTVDRATEIPLLQLVTRLDPHDAERRFVLGEAYLDVYKQRADQERLEAEAPDTETTQNLVEGLRHVLLARDLAPLLPAPHARIAYFRDELEQADPRSVYIERVKFLAPADPQLWYLCGLQEIEDHQSNEAWKSWRRSLQLSDRFLTRILDRAVTVLSPDEMLAKILPDQPAVLLSAASHLYPEPEAFAERQPILRKALVLCDNQPRPVDPEYWHTKAVIHVQLDQLTMAMEAYRSALTYDPRQVGWRYELAMVLHQQGQRRESRRELSMILGQNPNHGPARQLLETLAREAAEGSAPSITP